MTTTAEQLQGLTSPQAIHEMRDWLLDCEWGDINASDIAKLSDSDVLLGVNRVYAGGVEQFIRDGS